MNKFLSITCFFIYISCISIAQEYKKSPAIHLYNHPGSIAAISWDGNKYFTPAEKQFANNPQCLIKNNKGLYAALNGSGVLYKALLANDRIEFERIDSTVYFGDNFDSFIFSYRDTIYSLGGYGYWKTKGLLRYYIEQRHEWEIMKLNQEIPVLGGKIYDLFCYDQQNGKLYFGFTREENNTTTGKESNSNLHFETMVLDLVKKEWQQLGTLADFLKNDLTSIININSSPFGQMIAFRNKNLFLDYANNKIYRLSDTKQREIEQLPTSTGDAHVTYFIGSTFYSWLTSKNLIDSLVLQAKDLVLLNEKIYIEGLSPATDINQEGSNKKTFVLFTLIGLSVIAGSGYYFWKKKKQNTGFPQQQENNSNGNHFVIPFSPLEIEVISTIAENSLKGNYTSIEEVNKALGVSKKNIEIQKKQRSDIITSINKKYSYIKQSPQELIEKRRTEFDKRSF
ncbi:MAG: LPXTG cell wall anchor domain-containing protein, partial [Bacteroidota bacterium]|nr:LPXTG cell wall anchor domain-containing protein [Bacteroidota bacterium]